MKWVKKADILAPPVELNMAGTPGLKSMVGVALTLGYIGTIIGLGYFIVARYFDTTSPSINSQSSVSDTSPRVDLIANGYFPVAYVFLQGVQNVPIDTVPSFVTMMVFKYSWTDTINADGTATINLTYSTMPVLPCKTIMADPQYAKHYKSYQSSPSFQKFAMGFGSCVQVNESLASVQGSGSEPHIEIFAFQILPCSLNDSSLCAPLAYVKALSVAVTFPTTSLNLSNYEKPYSRFLEADNPYSINEQLLQKYQAKFYRTEIWDDPGIYFPQTLRTNYSDIDKLIISTKSRNGSSVYCTTAEIMSNTCFEYISYEFMSSGRTMTIVRSYYGLIAMFSDVGGINSLVFLLFLWTNFAYISLIHQHWMVSSVFSFFGEGIFKIKEERKVCGCIRKKNTASSNQPNEPLATSNSARTPRVPTGVKEDDCLDPQVIKQLQDEAFRVIEKSLDIVNIVREVNNLKVLTHLMFKDYHLKLLPLISLSLQFKIKEKKRRARRESMITPIRTPSNLSRVSDWQHSIERKPSDWGDALGDPFAEDPQVLTFIGSLKKVHQKNAELGDVPQDQRTLDDKIDAFCYESLGKGDRIFANFTGIEASPQQLNSPTSPSQRLHNRNASRGSEFTGSVFQAGNGGDDFELNPMRDTRKPNVPAMSLVQDHSPFASGKTPKKFVVPDYAFVQELQPSKS